MTAAARSISPADVGPSQLFQQVDHIGRSGLIISALPELVITQDAPSSVGSSRAVVFLDEVGYDWTIFADRVVVRGTIKLAADPAPDSTRAPARSPAISLFAREIACEMGTKPGFEAPAIVVDGTNGTDHKEPFATAAPAASGKGTNGNYSIRTSYGYHNRVISSIVPSGKGPTGSDGSASPATGGQGGDAGSIRIVAESLLQSLALSARGGDGGRGQQGQQGGTGGPGGDGLGSDGYRVFVCVESLPAVAAGIGGDGGKGGPGGAGGSPGKGGVVACKLVKAGLDCVHSSVDGGKAGVAGAPGDGGLPGPAGRGATNCWYIVRNDNYPFFIESLAQRAVDISAQDAAASLSGTPGKPGKPGETPDVSYPTVAGSAQAESIGYEALLPYADLVHFSMLVDLAKLSYAAGDPSSAPEALEDAQRRFDWLHNIVSALDTSAAPPDVPSTDVPLWKSEYDVVTTYWNQLNPRVTGDVYGLRFDYVPLLTFGSYLTALTDAQPRFAALQSSYQEFLQSQSDSNVAREKLEDTQTKLSALSDQQDARLSGLWSDLATMVKTITQATQDVSEAQATLTLDLHQLIADLEKSVGCGWDNILSGLGMVALVSPLEKGPAGTELSGAGSFNAAVQGATLYRSATKSVADSATGGAIDGSLLVSRLETIDGTLDSIKAQYSAVSTGPMSLLQVAPDSAKLLQTAEDLQSLLDKIVVDVGGLEAARAEVTAFIQLLSHRNQLILQYNNLVASILRITADRAATQARSKAVGDRITLSAANATTPFAIAATGRMFNQMRQELLYQCHMMVRAYRFQTLDDSIASDLAAALSLANPSGFTADVLASVLGTTIASYQQSLENNIGELDYIPLPEGGAVGSWPATQASPYRLLIDDPKAIAGLKTNKVLRFDLTGPSEAGAPAPAPFQSLTNVRVIKMRVWLAGLALPGGDGASGPIFTIAIVREGACGDVIVNSRTLVPCRFTAACPAGRGRQECHRRGAGGRRPGVRFQGPGRRRPGSGAPRTCRCERARGTLGSRRGHSGGTLKHRALTPSSAHSVS